MPVRLLLLAGAAAIGFAFVIPQQRSAGPETQDPTDLPEVTQGHADKALPAGMAPPAGNVAEISIESLSLLQLNDATSNLPSVKVAAERPRELITTIDSKLSALTKFISKSYRENEYGLGVQVAEYENKLAAQKNQIMGIMSTIDGLHKQISAQQDANKVTRTTANNLREKAKVLMQSMHGVESNLSFAQEFARRALGDADHALAAETLKVLANLDKIDEQQHEESEHSRKLARIGGQSALLQLDATYPQVAAQTTAGDALESDLVSTLQSAMTELSAKHVASLERLKANFTELFEAGQAQQTELLKEQVHLESELQKKEDLGRGLKSAVAHLDKTNAELDQSGHGIEVFANRLGSLDVQFANVHTKVNMQSSSKPAPRPQRLNSRIKSKSKPAAKKR